MLFDRHFKPTCVQDHYYRYESYNAKHETITNARPSKCAYCWLKKAIARAARGSLKWKLHLRHEVSMSESCAFGSSYFSESLNREFSNFY